MLRDATIYQQQGRQRDLILPPAESAASWCALVHWNRWPDPPAIPPSDEVDSTADPVEVFVEHGWWKVRCPCGGCQYASSVDHRFFCVDCLNHEGASGKWRAVTWPDNADAIENLLLMRPDDRTRNWFPGETLQDLVDENTANGVFA